MLVPLKTTVPSPSLVTVYVVLSIVVPSRIEPEKVTCPPLAAVSVTPLPAWLLVPRMMSPENSELSAVLPPRVSTRVPTSVVLFVEIRMFRPTVKAPAIRILALLLPLAMPTMTSLVALPNAPAEPEGASAPTRSVPAVIVVTPP